MKALAAQPILPQTLVTGKLNITAQTLRALQQADLIEIREEISSNQRAIVTQIMAEFRRGIRQTYLLHGVTGSGKTEVYMELIEQVISEGRQTIMLIQETARTYQTLVRF